jgi:hypothetical protein
MKRIIFTISLLSTILTANLLFSQACSSGNGPSACTPTGGPASGGFEDPNTTPCAILGTAYNHSIQFTMFSVFNYLGTQSVDSIQFTSIDNLPCGLCWSVNQTDKTYSANEDGCINIKGTTNDAPGQYKLALALKAWINGNAAGLPVPATLVDQTGIKLLLRVKTPTGTCVTADTSSNANNLQASISCPLGITDLERSLTSINLVPNPLTSSSIFSFIAEKTESYSLRITDIRGSIVSSDRIEVKQGLNAFTIQRNGLASGIYILVISDGKSSITSRFDISE